MNDSVNQCFERIFLLNWMELKDPCPSLRRQRRWLCAPQGPARFAASFLPLESHFQVGSVNLRPPTGTVGRLRSDRLFLLGQIDDEGILFLGQFPPAGALF